MWVLFQQNVGFMSTKCGCYFNKMWVLFQQNVGVISTKCGCYFNKMWVLCQQNVGFMSTKNPVTSTIQVAIQYVFSPLKFPILLYLQTILPYFWTLSEHWDYFPKHYYPTGECNKGGLSFMWLRKYFWRAACFYYCGIVIKSLNKWLKDFLDRDSRGDKLVYSNFLHAIRTA